MADEICVAGLGLFYALVFAWGFRTLPREEWQIFAALPTLKTGEGSWKGLNLTYYGFFSAGAYSFGTAVLFFLLGSVGVPVRATLAVALLMAAICVPSSRWIAAAVEGKAHTSTVGGASFMGIVAAPWCVWCADAVFGSAMGFSVDVMSVLAALSVAYAFGEGTGRLGCISFGCCYGKPLSQCGPLIRFLFGRFNFVFKGKTKKIAYESGMDEEAVVPIQAVTSVIYVSSALVATYLFLKGRHSSAFLTATVVTQVWRFMSEFYRADYRGSGCLSAYQWMGLLSVPYTIAMSVIFARPAVVAAASVTAGLSSLWSPAVLILLEATWLAMFLLTGRSMVTGSFISFHVNRERI